MVIVQLMASPFYGGPEKQMLGLARSLPAEYTTAFLSFAEAGKCGPLLEQVRRHGFEGAALEHNFPRFLRGAEVARHLRRVRADVVCCSGYKPDVIGWLAGRQAGVPVVSVSHGWTAATLRVRFNEAIDRALLRWFDAVVCVSEGQAVKVRRAGVAEGRIAVIRNAVGEEAFAPRDPARRAELEGWFAARPRLVVGAAGRLSPEKGFDQLIDAAALVTREMSDVGFVVFGDGPLRGALTREVEARGLRGRFVLAGFRPDLGKLLPSLDVAALSSHTEGLPVVALEALAAGVPVVSTAVGGTPEVIDDGVSGYLVPPRDPAALARRLLDALRDDRGRRAMGEAGRERVRREFTFASQAVEYQRLFRALALGRHAGRQPGRGNAPGAQSARGVAPGYRIAPLRG